MDKRVPKTQDGVTGPERPLLRTISTFGAEHN